MPTDPWFYAVAAVAVFSVGVSKGGFGGAGAIIGVPLLAIFVTPFAAVGIMLPILLAMDAVAVWSYRKTFDRKVIWMMLPGGLVGSALAWMVAANVSVDLMRLLVGVLGLSFIAFHYLRPKDMPAANHSPVRGNIAGAGSGFTSFLAHAGGPPFQIYTIPLKLEPVIYAGTGAVFFAIINAIKVVPYLTLNQLTWDTFVTSMILLPWAVVSTYIGVFLVKIIDQKLYYQIVFTLLFLVSTKLVWDGATGLL